MKSDDVAGERALSSRVGPSATEPVTSRTSSGRWCRPRATSANIAFACSSSHSTAEPTGVRGAGVRDRHGQGEALAAETLRIALAIFAISKKVVSSPMLTASAVAVDRFQ